MPSKQKVHWSGSKASEPCPAPCGKMAIYHTNDLSEITCTACGRTTEVVELKHEVFRRKAWDIVRKEQGQ